MKTALSRAKGVWRQIWKFCSRKSVSEVYSEHLAPALSLCRGRKIGGNFHTICYWMLGVSTTRCCFKSNYCTYFFGREACSRVNVDLGLYTQGGMDKGQKFPRGGDALCCDVETTTRNGTPNGPSVGIVKVKRNLYSSHVLGREKKTQMGAWHFLLTRGMWPSSSLLRQNISRKQQRTTEHCLFVPFVVSSHPFSSSRPRREMFAIKTAGYFHM